MNGVMYDDDQQVWKLSVERGEKIKGGGCQVTISEYRKNRMASLIEDLME